MPAGGKRIGAGRKPGSGWKGKTPRPEAMRNLAKSRVREVLSSESDPLAVLVAIAADIGNDPQLRVQAATAACPFIFPRLSASVVANAPAPSQHDTSALVDRILGKIGRLAPAIAHQPMDEPEAAQ